MSKQNLKSKQNLNSKEIISIFSNIFYPQVALNMKTFRRKFFILTAILTILFLKLNAQDIQIPQDIQIYCEHNYPVADYISNESEIKNLLEEELFLMRDLVEHWEATGYKNKLGEIAPKYDFILKRFILERKEDVRVRMITWQIPELYSFFFRFMSHISAISYTTTFDLTTDPLLTEVETLLDFFEKTPLNYSLILLYYNIYVMEQNLFRIDCLITLDNELNSFFKENRRFNLSSKEDKEILKKDFPNTPIAKFLKMRNIIDDLDNITYGILKCSYNE